MNKRATISATFNERLRKLAPRERVRVVVLLDTRNDAKTGTRRSVHSNRMTTVVGVQGLAVRALGDIDKILANTGGKRLTLEPTSIGNIVVEATPAGIAALARLDHVRAIFEDQAVSLLAR